MAFSSIRAEEVRVNDRIVLPSGRPTVVTAMASAGGRVTLVTPAGRLTVPASAPIRRSVY